MKEVEVISVTAYNLYDFMLGVTEQLINGFVIPDTVPCMPKRIGAIFTVAMVKGANVKIRDGHNATVKQGHASSYGLQLETLVEPIQEVEPVVDVLPEVIPPEDTPPVVITSDVPTITDTTTETTDDTLEEDADGEEEEGEDETQTSEPEAQGVKRRRKRRSNNA